MHELTDRDYEAQAVLGVLVSQLEQRLGDGRSFGERAHVADHFFLRRCVDVGGSDGISEAASQILMGGGNVRIVALAEKAGLSTRQFERGSSKESEFAPNCTRGSHDSKRLLIGRGRCSTKSWTDVAHEFGYYDQMHMGHDFEDFTGETPTNMLSRTEMVFREQLAAMRSSRLSADADRISRLVL
jgi:AraC-like DNA-binding protein